MRSPRFVRPRPASCRAPTCRSSPRAESGAACDDRSACRDQRDDRAEEEETHPRETEAEVKRLEKLLTIHDMPSDAGQFRRRPARGPVKRFTRFGIFLEPRDF